MYNRVVTYILRILPPIALVPNDVLNRRLLQLTKVCTLLQRCLCGHASGWFHKQVLNLFFVHGFSRVGFVRCSDGLCVQCSWSSRVLDLNLMLMVS